MGEFILTGKAFQHLMTSILGADPGYRVKVRGRGVSMIPFIKDNSAIILKPVDRCRGVKFGDIVARFQKRNNIVLVHRVIRSRSQLFLTKGDNNPKDDGWCTLDDIIGIVDKIENNGWIPYNCRNWQNTLIALSSRTGVFNRIIYPGFILMRKLIK